MKAVLVAVLMAGLGACASKPPASSEPQAAAQQQKECLRETGSRIKRKQDGCVDSPGRVITAEEIQATGATTVGEAIDRLGR